MRATMFLLLVGSLCTGCAPANRVTQDDEVADPATREQSAEPSVAQSTEQPASRVAPSAALPVAPPAMTEEQIAALVKSVVAGQLAQRDEDREAATSADLEQVASAARAATIAAENTAQQAAEDQTAAAYRAARQEDELLARFLLLPDELSRVERIKEKLKTDSIWGLTRQDLDFASAGFAAPLLHDALYEAAQRNDPDIEIDVLARKANLTPEEKLRLATLPPIERARLLMFTDQFKDGTPSPAADRYIRDFIIRYPFIRKILLEHLRETGRSP